MPKTTLRSRPGRTPAGLTSRLLAALFDGLFMLALSTPLMWLAYRERIARLDDTRPASLLINWLLPALVCIGFWTWQGATPGKLLAGIRVVDARTGARPGLRQSALRWLGYLLSTASLGLGFLWAALDADKQAWQDKLAGTLVVPRRANAGPGYIAAHWYGEQSLAQSFWVNNVLLSWPLGLALTSLMSWISLKGEALQASAIATLIGWPLMIVIDAWCIVGAWRAAGHYRRSDGSTIWATLARLSLAIGALHVGATAVAVFLPQVGTYWQMARGIDPIGQARFTLSADGRTLQLSGPIGMGDATRLQQLLASAPQLRLVELASPGGRVYEAERMVELLRKGGASTRAVGDCESACTLVFLAGAPRQLMPGAQLGFHRASTGTYNPMFDELANRELSATYRRIGLPEYFIERTARTPSRSMWYPRSEELVAHALIVAPPQTLDIALPAPDSPLADYLDALRANPSWYLLEARYAGLTAAAAARMRAAHQARASDDAVQIEALQVVAPHLPALIVGSTPELRRRYLGVLKAQLKAARAGSPGQCQALLAGQLSARRQLPAELLAAETAWLAAAASAPPSRWLTKPPSSIELEVVRRTLGTQAPGMLSAVWPDGAAGPGGTGCDAVIQILDHADRLPVAQRELGEREVFQRS